jgi:hypothetical protein
MAKKRKVVNVSGLGSRDALRSVKCAADAEIRQLICAADTSIRNVMCAANLAIQDVACRGSKR